METIKIQNSELATKINDEYQRATNLQHQELPPNTDQKPEITPLPLEEYINECKVIGKEEFPDITKEDIVNALSRASMDNYPQGNLFCLAIVPFINPHLTKEILTANKFTKKDWDNFIETQSFLKGLSIYPNHNNLTSGMNETMGYYFDILPKELQKDISHGGTTFKLDYPKYVDARAWFAEQYLLAYENLKKLLTK